MKATVDCVGGWSISLASLNICQDMQSDRESLGAGEGLAGGAGGSRGVGRGGGHSRKVWVRPVWVDVCSRRF